MGGQPGDIGSFGGQLELLNWVPPTSVKNGAGTFPILWSPATYLWIVGTRVCPKNLPLYKTLFFRHRQGPLRLWIQ